MSVALEYEAVGRVPGAVRQRIAARAARAAPRGRWWAEGLSFVGEEDSPDAFFGSTKLMLVDAPPEVDLPMALRDAAFILRRLAWWSLRYGVTWRISIEGQELGTITRGVPSPRILVRLSQFAGIARFVARTPVLFLVRRRALRDYASRWD